MDFLKDCKRLRDNVFHTLCTVSLGARLQQRVKGLILMDKKMVITEFIAKEIEFLLFLCRHTSSI